MTEDEVRPMTRQQAQGRRKKSIAIALALLGIVVLFYIVTIVRLGENVANRGL